MISKFLLASLLGMLLMQSPFQNKQKQLELASDSLRVHLLSDLCYEYRLISQDSAIQFGQEAIQLAKSISYDKGLAQAYNDLGIIYADRTDLNMARDLYKKSLSIRIAKKDSLGMAAVYSKLGVLYQKVGKLDSALINQFKCLEIYELLKSKFGVSYTFNNIAIIFFNKGDHASSLKYHKKALTIRRAMNDQLGIATSLGNIGNIYFEEQHYQLALENYKQGLNILISLESWDHVGSLCNNISNIFLEQGLLDSAKTYLQQSIDVRLKINDTKGLISSYHNMGKLLYGQRKWKASQEFLNKSLRLATENNVHSSLLEIHKTLMDLNDNKGQSALALHHARRFIMLKDSINNLETQRIIAELQTEYETEKKEQQIAIQESEIAEQKAQNQRNVAAIIGLVFIVVLLVVITLLMRSRASKKQALIRQEAEIKIREMQIEAALNSQEDERKRFARDLHDGFGQLISVLNLNLRSLEKGGGDRESIFENSAKILDDMYKELKGICFNLMPETLIKQGVIDAIKEFASRINQASKVFVEIDTFGIDKRLSDVQEISLYRITQEWTNNILKYSDADKITISLTRDDEELTLLIEDNGSGFDKDLLVLGKGNGWKNINSRANLIKGELELDTTLGFKGTTLILNVPIFNILSKKVAQQIPS